MTIETKTVYITEAENKFNRITFLITILSFIYSIIQLIFLSMDKNIPNGLDIAVNVITIVASITGIGIYMYSSNVLAKVAPLVRRSTVV